MTVKGPMMRELDRTCQGADPATINASNDAWSAISSELKDDADELLNAVKYLKTAFAEASYSGSAAVNAFKDSGTALEDRATELKAAVEVLRVVSERLQAAEADRAAYEMHGPDTHGPAPDPSSQKYSQSGLGVDTAQAVQNQKALASDRAAYAAEEAAIAAGEARAAHHIEQTNDGFVTADPKVRAITEDPNDGTGGSSSGGIGGAGSTAPYALGSASRVRAAEERKAGYRPEVTYPGGWGHELIAAENEVIDSELGKNEPEWDGNQWINADGSAAESTEYATVETADGLAPLPGGSSGAVALGVGVGGAAVGAGIAKMVASKFSAANAAKLASATSGSVRTGAARAGAAAGATKANSTAGRTGAGSGAGQRSAGRAMTGSGSRAGMRGGAGGAGGRTGGKNDNKARGKGQEFLEETDEQWTDPNGNNVLDANAEKRSWTTYDPKTQNPDGSPKSR